MWGGRSKTASVGMQKGLGKGAGGQWEHSTGAALAQPPPKARGCLGYLGRWVRAIPLPSSERSVRQRGDGEGIPVAPGETLLLVAPALPRNMRASRRQQLHRRNSPPTMLWLGGDGDAPKRASSTGKRRRRAAGSPVGLPRLRTRDLAGRSRSRLDLPLSPAAKGQQQRLQLSRGTPSPHPVAEGRAPRSPPPPAPSSPPAEVPTRAAAAKTLATRSGHQELCGALRALGGTPGTQEHAGHSGSQGRAVRRRGVETAGGGRTGRCERAPGAGPGRGTQARIGAGAEHGRGERACCGGGCGFTYLLRWRLAALGGAPSPGAR